MYHLTNRSRRSTAVVAAVTLATAAFGVAPRADAAVTWGYDSVIAEVTVRASAGEALTIQCLNDRVRTSTGIVTSAPCSAVKSLVVTGSALIDTIDLSAVTRALFPLLTTIVADGKDGDDKVTGSPLNDTLLGGSGADRLTGGAGNDVLTSGSGNDTVFGGAGLDTISGGSGDDVLTGHDLAASDLAVDTVNGGPGADIINAQDGDRASNPTIDPATDVVKWTLTWDVKSFGASSASDRAEIRADVVAKWSIGSGTLCSCTALRAKSLVNGINKGVDTKDPTKLFMSTGNDVFVANYTAADLFPRSALSLDAGTGADELRIVVTDPAAVTVTATEVRFTGAGTITYTGFENVRVVLG